ncbi:MAG: hypothetical protein ACMX3H_03345 [Sodalis sp. (in: enterobacteria)]
MMLTHKKGKVMCEKNAPEKMVDRGNNRDDFHVLHKPEPPEDDDKE